MQQEVLVRKTELISHHQPEEFRKDQKETPPCLTTSQNPSCWHPSWLSKVCTTRKDTGVRMTGHHQKTQEFEPCGRAVLGSLTLPLSARVPFPNKSSCFVSSCVSSDSSFPSARQEPTFRLGRGPPSCNTFRAQIQLI